MHGTQTSMTTIHEPDSAERATLLTLYLAASAAVIVIVVGRLLEWPVSLTLFAPAVVGAAIGVALLGGWIGPTRGSPDSWQLLFGWSIALWSAGQVVLAAECEFGGRAVLSPGETMALVALVLAAFALSGVIRNSNFARPGLRLGVDALMLGTTLCLLVWRERYEIGPRSGSIAITLVPDFVLGAFVVLLAVRRPTVRELVFITGLAAVVVGNLFGSLAVIEGAGPSAGAAMLYCLGLPALSLWPHRFGSNEGNVDAHAERAVPDLVADSRQAGLAVGGTLTAAAVFVVVQFIDRHAATTAGSVIMAIATGSFFVRVLLDHRQRTTVFGQLNDQLRTDSLTQLGNRLAIEQLDAADEAFDLIVVGVDGVGRLSELHGHEAGDALMLSVARSLEEAVPERFAIARLDGYEFAIAIGWRVTPEANLMIVHEATERAVLREQFAFGRQLTVSTGAARSDGRDRSSLATLARAQRARHLARQEGSRMLMFDDDMRVREHRLRLIDQRLPSALDDGLIEVHLQPVVDLGRRAVVGVEALARWTDDDLGEVRPDEFIPRAEANGEVVRLGLSVLRSALRAAVELGFVDAGRYVAVNVSVGQLRANDDGGRRFSDHVAEALAATDLPPGVLVCEITESMLIVETDPAVHELQRLSAMGVRIAIDDFGSGHWALGSLRWLPADIIKIDRSLVRSIDTNARARDVVGSIVGLSHRLGATLIAEGVETQAMAEAADELGVGFVQGWCFARAVPVGELCDVIRLLESERPNRDADRFTPA